MSHTNHARQARWRHKGHSVIRRNKASWSVVRMTIEFSIGKLPKHSIRAHKRHCPCCMAYNGQYGSELKKRTWRALRRRVNSIINEG